jgi:hypothetical protein
MAGPRHLTVHSSCALITSKASDPARCSRSGLSRDWLKIKNPTSPAMIRGASGRRSHCAAARGCLRVNWTRRHVLVVPLFLRPRDVRVDATSDHAGP